MLTNKILLILIVGLIFTGAFALTACSSSGGSKSNAELADIYMQLGVRYMSLNKLDLAKENLEKSLQRDDDNPKVHNALAVLAEKLNLPNDAKRHHEKALSLAPDDLSVQNNFGRFLCEQGEIDKGLLLLDQAGTSGLNERPWLALTNAALCELKRGQAQKAEAYLRQALNLDASYAPALQAMQKISYQKGDFWGAKGYLQRYLGLAGHTSETLWVGWQTERALGNDAVAQQYKRLLLELFPLSEEANKINLNR
ncbi:MAG: type IV pilus biogenesis/stability protein PilW [Methylococcaceae bacterium]|jgi:type IV pilus assembly protein PilF